MFIKKKETLGAEFKKKVEENGVGKKTRLGQNKNIFGLFATLPKMSYKRGIKWKVQLFEIPRL